MSAETLDLEDLESIREDVHAAVLAMLSVGCTYPAARDTLVPVMFRLGWACETIESAIEAHGEAKPERTVGNG